MKKILLTILILGLIGLGFGYYLYNKPTRNVSKATADFTMTPKDLLGEFTSDENTANSKYLDKIISVSGILSEIDLSNEKEPTLYIETGDEMERIACGFKPKHIREIEKLKKGDAIKVKGECKGYQMLSGVVMTKCSFE